MIKLTRPNAPAELTTQVVENLTDQFKRERSDVWNKDYIRKNLLSMSHGKCAYCETPVDEESKYMEVDHFANKDQYPDLVVVWSNLIPSCKRCNTNKGSHNVLDDEIIDPTVDNPTQHMKLRNFRFEPLDSKGETTIDVIYLNQSDRLVSKRFEIGNRAAEAIDELVATWKNAGVDLTRAHRRVARGVAALMKEGTPPSEYSATTATSILEHHGFAVLVHALRRSGLWTTEHDALLTELSQIAFNRIPLLLALPQTPQV